MAMQFGSDPFALEQQQAQEALEMGRGRQNYRSPQAPGMVGRVFVGSHPMQHLAELLRVYKGGQQAKEAETKLADIGTRRNQAMTGINSEYVKALRGQDAVETPKEMFVADDAGGGEMTMGTQVTPAVAPNPMLANEILMKSQIPAYQQMGMENMMSMQEKQSAEAQTRAKQDQQRQLWQQSGQNPQAFLAAGGDMNFAKDMVAGQTLGQPTVVRTVDTVDSRGRPVTQGYDANNNPVGPAIPKYVAPKSGPAAPAGYRYKRDGSLEPIPGGPADPKNSKNASNVTEGERKAGTLLTRLRGSQAQLADVTSKNPSAASPSFIGQTLSGMGMETAGNLLTSSDRQRVNAAQLDLLDAALTLGTGAAYTKEQLQGYQKSFFPQIGDSPETIRDKEERLKNVIASAEIAAGRVEPESVPRFGPQSRPGPTPQNASQQKRIRFDSQGNIIP